jgi:predicted RNA-binding Zn-ribbon protein involved in translation (DUF1610 family)
VSFPCPECGASVDGRPDRLLLTCTACGARLRSRAVDAGGPAPVFEVQTVGRPETRRRVEIPWDEPQRRRLAGWLFVASVVTVGLVLVLFVLARVL